MKTWGEMNARERAEFTVKDIEKRKIKKEIQRLEGVKQADNFIFSHKEKSLKSKQKIRCKSYR